MPKNALPSDSVEKAAFKTAAMLMAIGVNPKRSALFCQSQLKHHDEFLWILSCTTPMKWLKGKEKKNYFTENKSVGTYTSEVMRVSDMILLNADEAVFGTGWSKSIELAGSLADGLNVILDRDHFGRPRVYKAPYYAVYKVNDLQNETLPMPRINKNKRGTIYLDDSDKDVREKVIRAKSDSTKEVTLAPL